MAILNPAHLFEQAERLVVPPPAGPPRQVDIRRSISAAYYAVFHSIAIAAADQFVGVTKRSTSQYGLVYRSVDHRWFRELSDDVRKTTPPAKYALYLPPNGFGPISAFAAAVVELQEKRHEADYNPMVKFNTADALLAVRTARAAVARFEGASAQRRRAFLTLLLFPPRRG